MTLKINILLLSIFSAFSYGGQSSSSSVNSGSANINGGEQPLSCPSNQQFLSFESMENLVLRSKIMALKEKNKKYLKVFN